MIQKQQKLKRNMLVILDLHKSKLAQANVITKRNFDAKIVEIENSINKLKTFDLKYFRGKNRFENDGTQNYLVFQQRTWYFKVLPNTNYVAL